MRPHGGKGFARNEGMGESSANEGNKTDHQTDQKLTIRSLQDMIPK